MPYIAGINRVIDTGNTYFAEIAQSAVSGSGAAKRKLARDIINAMEVADVKPLEARIEYARYIVDCPNCNSAEFVFEDNRFLCSMCNNSDVGGKARKVKMPKERERIEDILSKRGIQNRHWQPDQKVQDLENENKAHGLGGE